MQTAILKGNNSSSAGGGVVGGFSSIPDEDFFEDEDSKIGPAIQPPTIEELSEQLDRVKKDKIKAYNEIERYQKTVTYAIIFSLFSFATAIVMVIWRFTEGDPSFEEMRHKILSTPLEEPRLCFTLYPETIDQEFDEDAVGKPLMLTPLIQSGQFQLAAKKSRVENVLQSETSYSGFLTVEQEYNSSLFFWYFPSRSKDADADIPLVIWIQGGPGWPTMYGLFKENGPYLTGWDDEEKRAYLIPNKFSWTNRHHMLYIDNPVGAGFSSTGTK